MQATLADVCKFFRLPVGTLPDGTTRPADTLKTIRDEWALIKDADQAQIRTGLSDGTLTYQQP